MKLRKRQQIFHCILLSQALVLSPFQALGSPRTEAQKLERLSQHLSTIEEKAFTNRMVGGTVLLGAGAFFISLGVVATKSKDEKFQRVAPVVHGLVGGTLGLTGLSQFLFSSEFEKLPETYQGLPEGNAAEQQRKITVGEAMLTHLKDNARLRRFISGGVLFGLGAVNIGAGLSLTGSSSASRGSLVTSGAFLTALGLVNVLIEAESEGAFQRYQNWKAGKPDGEAFTKPRVGIFVTEYGPSLGVVVGL